MFIKELKNKFVYSILNLSLGKGSNRNIINLYKWKVYPKIKKSSKAVCYLKYIKKVNVIVKIRRKFMLPLISVIMPIYNVEQYVEKALKSCLDQSYTNLEILLIDDGSTDRSKSICQFYLQQDSRVKLVSQKNKGAGAARNQGLKHAKGKYIMFMDSDDTIHPETIMCLYNLIIQYDTELSMIDFMEVKKPFNEWGKIEITESKVYSQKEMMEILCCMRENVQERLQLTVPWGKLYKRDLLDGLFYPEGIICEDEFMINQIVCRCQKMGYANVKMYAYLKREDSVMGVKYDSRRLASIKAFEDRIQCAHQLQLWDCEAYISRIFMEIHIRNYCKAYAKNCEDVVVYQWLRKSFRKNLKKYWKYLTLTFRLRSVVFFLSPTGYILLKKVFLHKVY